MFAKIIKTVVLTTSICLSTNVLAGSVLGYWKTVDDQTGEDKSILQIKRSGNKITGKVIKVLKTDDGSDPETRVCDSCTGKNKNKRIKGMTVMWGLEKTGENEWSGGEILDPKTGKIYNVTLTLDNNPNILNVRGFIGFSLFGRTQVWYRLNNYQP